ncbi:MAG TPA: LysR family transcriptional regulator [Devosiaceae bacterium]
MNFAIFDLNLLRVLDALLREGSTVKAGERLALSQSAVSGALSRLRHATGDDLFVRHGNRLVPTDYARALELPVREHLDELAELLAAPEDFDPATATGTFRITASDFFAEMLMPALAHFLAATAPGVRAQLVDLVPYDYIESLERYRADLAIIPDTDLPRWVGREPLFRSSFVVVARKGHPLVQSAGIAPGGVLPLDLFCGLGHVLFSPEGTFRAMGDAALERIGRRRRVVMTLPVFSGVCRAVGASDHVALVPRQLAERVRAQLGLEIYRPPVPIDVPLIVGAWHRRATRNPFQAWMRQRVFDLLRPLNAGETPLR